MSASWFKANGMRDNSNAEELARRKYFMVDAPDSPANIKPDPTAAEWARAATNGRAEVYRDVVSKIAARLRMATAVNKGRSWWRKLTGQGKIVLTKEELDALPKVDSTMGEFKYQARWNQEYVDSLRPGKWITDAVKKAFAVVTDPWGWRKCLDWMRWGK